MFTSALALVAGTQAQSLQREAHDHTIYTVQGSAEQLRKFQSEVLSQWQGGVLLNRDEDQGVYRYWAFSERSAPQARTFIFGSMMLGLKLDIQAYEEQQFFPAERSALDDIASSCRFARDPFFITPTREIRLSFRPNQRFQMIDCAMGKLRASKLLKGLKTVSIGNKAPLDSDQ
jgi:hypothetical protein